MSHTLLIRNIGFGLVGALIVGISAWGQPVDADTRAEVLEGLANEAVPSELPAVISQYQPETPPAAKTVWEQLQRGVESGFGTFNDRYYRVLFYPVDHFPTLIGLTPTPKPIQRVQNAASGIGDLSYGDILENYDWFDSTTWSHQAGGNGATVTFTGRTAEVNLDFTWAIGPDGQVRLHELAVHPYSPPPPAPGYFPLILCIMVFGGVFFTFRYGWVNVGLFRHAIHVVRGQYDRPDDPGEVSHFKALTSALSATVGLGNISGVAVAITMGGPGAVFWMWVTAVFGMSMKFSSCTFAQLYRRVKDDGTVLGGPMVYLNEGIRDRFPVLKPLGVVFSVMFAILCILASFGGGNLFQANQTYFMFSASVYMKDGVLGDMDESLEVQPAVNEGPLEVAVQPGEASVVMQEVVVDEPVLESIPAPSTNPRIDLIQLGTDGSVIVRRGQEAAEPQQPTPDRGYIPLAYVYARPDMETITESDDGANGYIIDARQQGDVDMPPAWVAFVFGIILAIPVGLVLLGGIKRIGEVTSRLVPTMCIFYCTVCFVILMVNLPNVPTMFMHIITEAFAPKSVMVGGFIGVLVQGMRRAAFSNEAGLGSAAIAHAAAKTDEPVREGVVAMLGPFIDTICVCTMTALAILVTDSHLINPNLEGVQITALAFAQLGTFLPYFLLIAVTIFAFSTVISWGYYGEKATEYLVGPRGIMAYRAVYVFVVILGPVLSLQAIIDFADFMLLSMAFPNILGMILISGRVKRLVDDYRARLASGEMKAYK